MKRFFAISALIAIAFAGCTTYQDERDTTQPMKLQKSAFDPDSIWYMNTTVIDAPYEAGHTFPGETGGYFGLNKIKWVIEENYLYAYRTYEFIRDAAMAEFDEDYFGAPVAAYRIQKHFDVWHQYNPVTGEKMPVIYEAMERPWWDRDWMRVDWSRNHISAFQWMFSDICKWDGSIRTDPIAYYPTRPDDPEQFYVARRADGKESCIEDHNGVWVEDERSGGFCNVYGWDNIEKLEEFDYIDVVNREFVHMNIMGAQMGCIAYPHIPWDGGMQVTKRHSFLRIDDTPTYEPLFMPERAFERYGYFRLEREVYCPLWGARDMKDEFANRWNIWQTVYGPNGELLPKPAREVKPIIYYYVPTRKLPSQKACEQGREDFCIEYITDDLYHESAAAWDEAFQDILRRVGHPKAGDPEFEGVVRAKEIEYRCGRRDAEGNENTLPCQNMGDLRYSFIWNHDHVYAGSPGGYGPPLIDPESGEIVAGAANIYGGWWRRYAGMMGEYYDIAKGDLTEIEIMTGENVREYFANVTGNVLPPQMPLVYLEALEEHEARVERGELAMTDENRLTMPELDLKRDLDELKRSVGSDMDRRQALVGTSLERELIPAKMRWFFGAGPNTTLTEDVLDQISPFRESARWHKHVEETETFFGKRFVCHRDVEQIFQNPNYPALFDWAEDQLAAAGQPVTRETVIDFVLQRFWFHVAIHESGHTLGLRHQFEGHFDEENFLPEYWEILAEHPTIELGHFDEDGNFVSDYDEDGDGIISQEEYEVFWADYTARRTEQLEAGISMYRYSSVMDYLEGLHTGIMGLGLWDKAAIKFAYGGTIEVYSDNEERFDPSEVEGAGGWDNFVYQRRNRVDVPYYLGGERCNSNDDCPYVNHPRVPQRCRADRGRGGVLTAGTVEDLGVCSSVWDELDRLQENEPDVYPDYMFCSDERVRDQPFCSRGGAGISAQEMVQNAIDSYEWNYIFTNFRRYRGDTFQPYFYFSRLWGRIFQPLGKIHQSLLYNYYYTDGYAENIGRGGMLDTFIASRNSLNFFAKILATPDIGSYISWDPEDNVYDGAYTERHAGWADFYVPLGIGKYLWSRFDEGYYGQLYRYARIGTFFDKIFAIEAMTTRDWGLPQANDETFPLNYYDSFQDEMLALFTSIISGDMKRYAPVIKDIDEDDVVREIEYRDFWQGKFFGVDTDDFRGLEAVFGEDQSHRYQGYDVLDAGGSIRVRISSLLYALFDFPVFFDANFPSYVQLYSFGRPEAKDREEIYNEENNGNLVVYESPDRDVMYVAPVVQNDRSMFVPLLERTNEQAELLIGLRERVADGDWANFVTENPICGKILGLRTDNEENNRECILWLTNREEGRLDSMESFLSISTEFLYALGYYR